MIPLSLRRTTVLKNRRSLLETSSLSCIPAPSKNVSSHNWSVIVRSTDTDTAVPKLSFRAGGKGRKKSASSIILFAYSLVRKLAASVVSRPNWVRK